MILAPAALVQVAMEKEAAKLTANSDRDYPNDSNNGLQLQYFITHCSMLTMGRLQIGSRKEHLLSKFFLTNFHWISMLEKR